MNCERAARGRGSCHAPPSGPSLAGSLRPGSCKPGVGAPPTRPAPGSPLGGHMDTRTDRALGGRGRGGPRALLPSPCPSPGWSRSGGPCPPPGWLSAGLQCGAGLPRLDIPLDGPRVLQGAGLCPTVQASETTGEDAGPQRRGSRRPDRQKSQGPHGLGGHHPLHVLLEGAALGTQCSFRPSAAP